MSAHRRNVLPLFIVRWLDGCIARIRGGEIVIERQRSGLSSSDGEKVGKLDPSAWDRGGLTIECSRVGELLQAERTIRHVEEHIGWKIAARCDELFIKGCR